MPPGQEGQLCCAWSSLHSLLPSIPALPLGGSWGPHRPLVLPGVWAPGVMWEPFLQAPEAGPV